MSKLLRQLRISNLVSADDFEAANRRQQIYGGSFDTVLLELRILEPRVLDEQLAQSSGLPTVPPELLSSGLTRPWDAIPPALIDLGWAMPLARNGERVQVGVHPEIPDDQLDLIRDQPSLELMVTAECCLARLGSERTGSLTPQRYAILAASYVQAIGGSTIHQASESAGAPWKQSSVARKSDATLTPRPKEPPAPVSHQSAGPIMPPPPSDPDGAPPSWTPRPPENADAPKPQATLARVTPVQRQAGAIERTPPPPSFSAPVTNSGFGGRSLSYLMSSSDEEKKPPPFSFTPPPPRGADPPPPAAARQPSPLAPASPLAPPTSPLASTAARKTNRSLPKIDRYDATDMRRRFDAAKDRDQVTNTLLAGSACLFSRVTLLAVRKTGLKWLAASDREDEPAQTLVPLNEALYAALHSGANYARCDDPALQSAVGIVSALPCALVTVEVAGRPVLAVYVDSDGVALDDDDLESVRDMAKWAGTALTRIVRSKSAQKNESAPLKAPAGVPQTTLTDKSDSISLTPLTTGGSSAVPPLVNTNTAGGGTPPPMGIPTTAPRVVTPPPSEEISPKVPRLIDTAPPRSTTLISTQAPKQSPSPRSNTASGTLNAPPVRDLGAPIKPGSQATGAPSTIPPVRTPAPPVRSAAPPQGAPPVRMPPVRDGTLSPQVHKGQSEKAPPARMPPPESSISPHDATLIPSKLPVPPPADKAPSASPTLPPIRAAAPPIRNTPPPSRSNTLPGTQGGLTPLGAPLMQPPGRGRLILDDEDRHDDSAERSSERIPRQVLDEVIDAAMSDPTAIPALLELGEPALSRLASRFPGQIDIARRDLNNLPPLSAHGQLMRLAVQLGQRVSPMIRELLEHPEADVRFYAAFTFQELRDETALDGLATRAFDSDGDVRAIAMRVLETYSRAPSFSQRIASIRDQIRSSNMTRQIHAARAVGTLRDVEAVPGLIELLDHPEKRVRDIGLESLCSITGQQLGSRSSRWRSWYDQARGQHRIEWVMAALNHKDAGVRGWASIELRRITGQPYALPVDGSKRDREQVIKQWTDWWRRQGRAKFVGG